MMNRENKSAYEQQDATAARDILSMPGQSVNGNQTIANSSVSAQETTADTPDTVPPVQPPQISIRIAADRMAVYLQVRVFAPDQEVTPAMVAEQLELQGVCYGIDEKGIAAFCTRREFYKELVCASGKTPTDGVDGQLVYHFNKEMEIKPAEKEDGSIDYYDLGFIQAVKEGDELITLEPPLPGENGINVLGNDVAYRQGKNPAFPESVNTRLSEDGQHLHAAIDGCIEYKNNHLRINDVFAIQGDVDLNTGNIVFSGSVIISGDVREGFKVESGKDILVRGVVEGAVLEAKGSITISQGMIGMGAGKLTAGENITGKHFENGILKSGKNVYADVIMNSRVEAGDSVILKGVRGSIIGGTCKAGRMVYASNIGTETHLSTQVTVDSPAILQALTHNGGRGGNLEALREQREVQIASIEHLEEQRGELRKDVTDLVQLKKMMVQIYALKQDMENELKQLENQISEIEENTARLADYKILALGKIHPGVRLIIGPIITNVETVYQYTKFYADAEGLVSTQILPSEKL